MGTLSLPEEIKMFVLLLIATAQWSEMSPEELIQQLPELRGEIKHWPPELTVDAAIEMLRISPKGVKEWPLETRVAVKLLEWNRDDAEESSKFFKVCSYLASSSFPLFQSKSSS